MQLIYHPICPFSRQIRILISETNQINDIELKKEDYWLRNPSFKKISPYYFLPVLILNQAQSINDVYSITEYLIERYNLSHILETDLVRRSKSRSILHLFNNKFYSEVLKYIIDEKMIKFSMRIAPPDTNVLRVVRVNIKFFLNVLSDLLDKNTFLLSDKVDLADIVAASHISVLDYFSEIDWVSNVKIKEWYLLIKSRPSFRKLLKDYVIGVVPPKHYHDLDY